MNTPSFTVSNMHTETEYTVNATDATLNADATVVTFHSGDRTVGFVKFSENILISRDEEDDE